MSETPVVAVPSTHYYPDLFEIHDFTSFASTLQINQQAIFQHDYTLIWIRYGAGELFIDSQSFSIGSNVLFCLRPGQQLRFAPAVSGNGFVLSFATEFLDLHETKTTDIIRESLFNHFLVTPYVSVKEDASGFMHHVATKMVDEFSSNVTYKKEILKGFLKIFIIYASRAVYSINQSAMIPRKITLVHQFYLLLEKYYVSKKLVRDYAEMLHVSAGYLNDAVRESSGAAASHHIRQRVIREAKRKIFFHGNSMKEIAFSLGFSDQAHFSKYFKSISGKNFTDFRKEITS